MRKRWIGILVGAAVAIAAALFSIRAAFPPSRLRQLLEPRLEAALGRPLDIGVVRLAVLPLAVRLEHVRISDPEDPDTPALDVEAIELRPQLGALLRRELAIRSIRIVRPRIRLVQRADGRWNWESPAGAKPAPPASAAPTRSVLALRVESLQIESGHVQLHNEAMRVELESPFEAELALGADRALRDVTLSGWIACDSVRSGEHGALRGLPPLRLRLEPRVRIDVPDSTAQIESLRLAANDAVIEATGSVRRTGGKPVLQLETRSESIDLARLLAALPPGTAGATGLMASGTLKLDLRIEARPPAPPVAHGRIDLRDGTLQRAGLPERVSALSVALELAGDSLRLRDLSARVADSPVRVAGLVLRPLLPARSTYDLRVTAGLDLGRLGKVATLPPGTSLAGRADVDVRLSGRATRPDSVWIEGPIALHQLDVRTPLLLQPVRGEARLAGAGTVVRIESAELRAGESDLALTGTLRPALPPRRPRGVLQGRSHKLDLVALLPSQPPAAVGQGAARTQGEAAPGTAQGTAPAARATAPAAPTKGTAAAPLLPVVPPLDLQGTLQADEVVLPAATLRAARLVLDGGPAGLDVAIAANDVQADRAALRDVHGTLHVVDQSGSGKLRAGRVTLQRIEASALEADVAIAGRQLQLDNLRGTAYAGGLRGRAVVDYANPAAPAYDLQLEGDKVDANAFLGSVVPLLRNVVSGTMQLHSSWKYAGNEPKAILQSLSGSGQAAALEGRIQDLPALQALSSWLGMPDLKQIPYRDLAMHFDVDGGRVQVRDLALRGNDADVGVSGSVGLDGTLDLGLNVKLSAALSKRFMGGRSATTLASLFSDPSGRLVFDFALRGNHRAPRLEPDLQKTASRTGLKSLSGDLVRRLLGGLQLPSTGGAPGQPGGAAPGGNPPGVPQAPPGAPETPAGAAEDASGRALEDAGRRAVDEASRQLGSKLGGLFKRSATPDTAHARRDSTRH